MNYHKKECLLSGLFVLIMLTNCAGAATLNVPSGYASIQAAVDAASAGDTIVVQSGTYHEKVVVDKRLTLLGIGSPVVEAGGSDSAITLNAGDCILQGFVARNSLNGIWVKSSGNTISDNTATGNGYDGIHLVHLG